MKSLFKFYEYFKNKQGNTFRLTLIYVKDKVKVWEAKAVRAIPPTKVKDNIDRTYARNLLWLWRKRK
jgi:hypothetical protein